MRYDKFFVYNTLCAQEKLIDYKEQTTICDAIYGDWLAYDANIVIAPRRSLKTTSLQRYAVERLVPTGTVLVVLPYKIHTCLWREAGFGNSFSYLEDVKRFISGRDVSSIHLVVDEFCLLDRETYDYLIDQRWKSVTMVGTYKR